jgi:hypothetical protein
MKSKIQYKLLLNIHSVSRDMIFRATHRLRKSGNAGHEQMDFTNFGLSYVLLRSLLHLRFAVFGSKKRHFNEDKIHVSHFISEYQFFLILGQKASNIITCMYMCTAGSALAATFEFTTSL